MTNPAIKVNGLSKRYRIGVKEEIHDTLVGAAIAFVKSPIKNLRRLRRLSYFEDGQDEKDVIWALKDISFEVQKGEVVGVIGRNGAGKSTLLKVLAGITFPTAGRAEIDGRVASLLEVGTGFHQELTGRENVYLNGTILGMTRKEIDRKFDEIVEFSGVEKFIDTPVKRYSSGMRVRLAFSVAAHLEAEILLIDEVLAVGDVEFQKKCLGKMDEVAKGGRTILFVSHNMGAIQALCATSMLLSSGEIAYCGLTETAIQTYLQDNTRTRSQISLRERTDRQGSGEVKITDVRFIDEKTSQEVDILLIGMQVRIEVAYDKSTSKDIHDFDISIGFFNPLGELIFACRSSIMGSVFTLDQSNGVLYCKIPKWPLKSGVYSYNIMATSREIVLDWIKGAGEVVVESGDFYGTGKLPGGTRQMVFIDYEWSLPGQEE